MAALERSENNFKDLFLTAIKEFGKMVKDLNIRSMCCFCFATIECVTDFMIIDIYFSVAASG